MKGLFSWKQEFDQDLSKWDVSHVTDMRGMFYEATNFNNGGEPLNRLIFGIQSFNTSKGVCFRHKTLEMG